MNDLEERRLTALAQYQILDTPAEADFDELALTAARICGTPTALISFVDGERQWFKSRIGLDATETHRQHAFCAHAIREPDVFVVPDARVDPRFATNPLVTAAPFIRFYAGSPLRTHEGHALGTLCVIDRVLRHLSNEQLEALRTLSRQVVAQLELRRVTAVLERTTAETSAVVEALHASEELKTRLIECSRDCIKVLDLDGNLLSMNAGGMEVLEICDVAPFLGTWWIDFWEGEDRERARAAVETARRGGVGRFLGYFETRQNRTPRWWDVVVSPILDGDGKPDRLLALSRDATDLKLAQEELQRANDELERRVELRTADLAAANLALQREAGERQEGERVLRAVVEGVEAETGDRFFSSLVRHLANGLAVPYAFVSQLSADHASFRTLAVWGRGAFLDNFEIPVAGTPCEAVLNGEVSHHPERLQQTFPEDTGLGVWGVESYAGVPLLDSSGTVVGHLAIFDDKPMREVTRALSIMRIFATRARAEIERLRAEAALRESEARAREHSEQLHAITESALDAIVTFDRDRRIVLFNAAAEKVFGRPAAEAIGSSLQPFMTDGFQRLLDASVPGFDHDGQSRPYIWASDGLAARRADGREFPIEASLSRVEVRGRTLYTLILRDVDERRRAEEEVRRLNQQNEYLRDEIRAVHNVDDIVGSSAGLQGALAKVKLVAETDSSVLILGETGSGKELIARAVHAASKRKQRPLIKVNCAALPTGLIESELFGHERGAFTGATDKRVGRFELAAGGTIFLDEIGDMPLDVQAKLLRVLQEREFERVGGSRTLSVDVRVIAATNRDLAAAVAEGKFRQDLFYRLNVFPIEVPPLRTRRDDIPPLVHYFVARYAQKIGRRITHVSKEAMRRLHDYAWPGNVRELENVVERAVILCTGSDLDVAGELLPGSASQPTICIATPATKAPSDARSLEEIERQHIARVLRQTNGRVDGPGGAARLLEMNPSTLRSRIKKLGIRRPEA